jgi:ATPase subunit of ABC transporter with duplicated ATPase domains
MHKPILFKGLSLCLPHKTCFENFNANINYGSRIAIIGRNGSGKSTLLKMMQGLVDATAGDVHIPADVVFGYVPQVVEDFNQLSGGQRLNAAVTQALSLKPNVLLLDEPTNHLDRHNRQSLMRLLRNFDGTLIVVSHDTELLRHCIDTLWHIDNGQVQVFSGNYDDYMAETHSKRQQTELAIHRLDRQKKDTHKDLMKEQSRAAKSKSQGEKKVANKKFDKYTANAKASQGQATASNRKNALTDKHQKLAEQAASLRLPEILVPKFSITPSDVRSRMLVQINQGSVGYYNQPTLINDINFNLHSTSRVAIDGANGSGKSTFIKAILGDKTIIKNGDWQLCGVTDIGYLDQHYSTLQPNLSVLETIAGLVPHWPHAEVRRHLNDFLFRKNEEVNAKVAQLSGGEKARLSLAQIAAKTPKLLILDEITNNLDLETRQHMIDVLSNYPAALIIISHDIDFLNAINISHNYSIKDGIFAP